MSADSGESCSATLSSGSGQCSLGITHPGARTLTASYAFDSANAAGTGSATQNVIAAILSLDVDDHQAYARYGATLAYSIAMVNSGNIAASASVLAATTGTGLDLANAQQVCIGNGGGSGCGNSSGPLSAVVNLPGGGRMTWTLLVKVQPITSDNTVQLGVTASGIATSVSDSDTDILVLSHDGFEVPADGGVH